MVGLYLEFLYSWSLIMWNSYMPVTSEYIYFYAEFGIYCGLSQDHCLLEMVCGFFLLQVLHISSNIASAFTAI